VAAVGAAAIAACAVLTSRQVEYWKDDLALWSHTVAVTSDNYRAEDHLGVALTDRGMLEQGIQHYQAALRIWPDYPEGHNNLGAAYMDQKRYEDAVAEFSAAAKAKPRDVNFRYNLAVALDANGDRNAAIAEVKKGLAIDPTFPSLVRAAEVFGIPTARK
jgi:tetratricopeptide (TPR) repeat protein